MSGSRKSPLCQVWGWQLEEGLFVLATSFSRGYNVGTETPPHTRV